METLNVNCEDIRTQLNFKNNDNIDSEISNKNLSSHEGSPVIDRQNQIMDVELNGSKNDGQQFCLRWNNHQVSSVNFLF